MPQPLYICQNRTRDAIIGNAIRKADTPWARMQGLLPKSQLEPGEGLWIIPCNGIHSIGMRFVFDAVFLSKDNTVLHCIERMNPGRFSRIVWRAHSVLELDGGVIAATGTQIGDQLQWRSV